MVSGSIYPASTPLRTNGFANSESSPPIMQKLRIQRHQLSVRTAPEVEYSRQSQWVLGEPLKGADKTAAI
jgi:hypothetical protein